MTSIEMPEPVWQTLNATGDELKIAMSNLKFAMDCQKPGVEFLRETAHAIARVTFLADRMKQAIRGCYIIENTKGPKDSVTIFDLAGADMDEEAYEEDELEDEIAKAEAYHDER